MEIIWRAISWERENGGKGAGIKKHNLQVQNRQGDIKNGVGNAEAKEPIWDFRLLAKMEAQIDTLCLLAQPKEEQQI